MAIGAHDEEIGAKGRGLRQQKATDVVSFGRSTPDFHMRPVARQVTRDVGARFLTMTRMTFIVDDQDLTDSARASKGSAARRIQKNGPAGAQHEGLRQARRGTCVDRGLQAGNHTKVSIVSVHADFSIEVA